MRTSITPSRSIVRTHRPGYRAICCSKHRLRVSSDHLSKWSIQQRGCWAASDRFDCSLAFCGEGDVVEVVGGPGQGKTQLCLSAVSATAIQQPEATALYIAATTGAHQGRVRELVASTYSLTVKQLIQQREAQVDGWRERLVAAFPAAACAVALHALDDETTLQKLQDEEITDGLPPAWLLEHVCEAFMGDVDNCVDYEFRCTLQQMMFLYTFDGGQGHKAVQTVREAIRIDREPGGGKEQRTAEPDCAFITASGVALFPHLRPRPDSANAIDDRLKLLVVDGVQSWMLAVLAERNDMSGHAQMMHLGSELRALAKEAGLTVLVTNSLRKSRDRDGGAQDVAVPVQGGLTLRLAVSGGVGAVEQHRRDSSSEGSGLSSGSRPSPLADQAASTVHIPALGNLWAGIPTAKVMIVKPEEVQALGAPVVALKTADSEEGGSSAAGAGASSSGAWSASGRPNTVTPYIPGHLPGHGRVPLIASLMTPEEVHDLSGASVVRGAVMLHGPPGTVRDAVTMWKIPRTGEGVTLSGWPGAGVA